MGMQYTNAMRAYSAAHDWQVNGMTYHQYARLWVRLLTHADSTHPDRVGLWIVSTCIAQWHGKAIRKRWVMHIVLGLQSRTLIACIPAPS